MTPQLYIAKSGSTHAPTLPLDAVTRTFAVLGQRGTGKTNTAVVLSEEMARKGGHVAILDPVGAHYGITRRGEKKGIPGIVLGGEHGDVPLEETGGELVAELVVGRHWPVVVIDMKLMRKGAQLRFMADYLETLYQLNREPLCQVFEEADRPLPQQGRNFDVTAARDLADYTSVLADAVAVAERTLDNARDLPERQRVEEPSVARDDPARAPAGRLPAAPRPAEEFAADANSNGSAPLGKAPRTLLETLLSVHPRRLSKAELSTLSGYKPRSSTYRNALSALRTANMLSEAGGTFAPSDVALASHPIPPPKSPEDVRAMWRQTFGDSAPGKMLDMLVEQCPAAMDRAELARASGYSLTSSTYRNALSALRRNGLLAESGGEMRAADSLFMDPVAA